jgi:hypothetical protein
MPPMPKPRVWRWQQKTKQPGAISGRCFDCDERRGDRPRGSIGHVGRVALGDGFGDSGN